VGVRLLAAPRAGYRTTVEALTGPRPITRIVVAPAGWGRWNRLPELAKGE
jgi:hypothetical protein